MMKRALWVSVRLCLVLALALTLAEGQNLRVIGAGSGTLALQLMEEINVLQRIVPLHLSDEQLGQILALYAQHPWKDESEQGQMIAQLQEIKQRLLQGTSLVATDWAALRDIWRETLRARRGPTLLAPTAGPLPPGIRPRDTARAPEPMPAGAAETTLSPLESGIWSLLSTEQKAALLGDVRQPAANNQRAQQALGKRAMTLVKRLVMLEEARWPAERDCLAMALAAGAGAPDSPQYNNAKQLFVEFLERVRKMGQAEFARRQEELAAELLALFPAQTNLLVALAEYDKRLIHEAMEASFLHPRARQLLEEMKATRAQMPKPTP